MRLRSIFTAGLTGMFLVATAWAGVGIAPIDVPTGPEAGKPLGTPPNARVAEDVTLGADEALVGAAKVSIAPQPDAAKGEVWEHDAGKCTTALDGDIEGTLPFATELKSPWPENPSCIYAGGFGVGPSQPLTAFDEEFGLWSRSVAVQNGGGTVILTILDAEGYFARYNKMCRILRALQQDVPAGEGVRFSRHRRAARCRARDLSGQFRVRFDAFTRGTRLHRRLGRRTCVVHASGRRRDAHVCS
jgi:hypothetical protein